MSNGPVHPAIKRHLDNHKLCHEGDIESYLFPKLNDLPSPFLLKSIDTAVDLIISAIQNKDDILIWGDYDVDGITGTSLLHTFFKEIGVATLCHIPNRLTDGYGLNDKVLREYATTLRPNKLLITVDCGISNGEELILARKYGFKTIVTDHHQVPDATLYGDATINPKQQDCEFPFSDLSGVGVAFYLAAALRSKLSNNILLKNICVPNMKHYLAFVAIGTIADMMPLKSVNRILVKGGFESISSTSHKGIKNLLSTLDINYDSLTSDAVSFRIAPAINAAGRLGEPDKPLKLFLADSDATAKEYATQLTQLNNKRKQITENNFESALHISLKELSLCDSCLVILGDFHEGVLGIVASRLVEKYKVPTLVCCYHPADRNTIKGSGRAPEGYDLYRFIAGTERYLHNFGGHELAAGFSLPVTNFIEFKEKLHTLISTDKEKNRRVTSNLSGKYVELSLSESFDRTLLDNLMQLEPTGEANPKPVFLDRKVRFVSYSTFGKNKSHLKGTIRGKYKNVPIIGFNLAERIAGVDLNGPCSLLYTHSLESYNGKSSWRIHVKDIFAM